jgi:hypothetical protein
VRRTGLEVPLTSVRAPDRADGGALPGWTLPVALLGLAILLLSTLPALVALRRLQRAERSGREEIAAIVERTDRTRRDRRALLDDEFVIARSMRELLDPGLRAGSSAP